LHGSIEAVGHQLKQGSDQMKLMLFNQGKEIATTFGASLTFTSYNLTEL